MVSKSSSRIKHLCIFSVAITLALSHWGKKSYSRLASQVDFLPTHQHVPSAPALIAGREVLLVSLADYLGKGTNKSDQETTNLRLVSAGKPLILRDAQGIVHKASEINIAWSKNNLPSTYKVARQIIGPFASFESAEKVSNQLKNKGIKSNIAHPLEWEVWVNKSIQLPDQFKSRNYEKEFSFEINPILIASGINLRLQGPIYIEAKDGLAWEGGVYFGPFSLRPDAYGSWTFVEHVPLEHYLHGVVPYEIGSSSPFEALSAQAVLARTWALANKHRFQLDGYHLCSDTQCQVYKDPSKASPNVSKAIKKTSGKVLTWKGKPIHAVYHATNGGITASMDEAWSMHSLPYSRVMLDGPIDWAKSIKSPLSESAFLNSFLSSNSGAYGDQHYLFRWRRTYSKIELLKALKTVNSEKIFDVPKKIRVLNRGKSGRVLSLELSGSTDDFPIVLKLDNIRRVLRKLPSTLFIVRKIEKDLWEFIGGGFGHGVGMSQAGAIDLALRGWNAEKILLHYYPGATFGSFVP